MMRIGMFAPSPLALAKEPSSHPIGSMQAKVTRPTMPIGISRSVIGSVSAFPALRVRDAAIALARPLPTGFTNLSNVHIAETPIAPAPTPPNKCSNEHRDSDRQTHQMPNAEKGK